jgi:molecular chaperone DnaK
MVKDAAAHASEDKKRRELIETRNKADALIHTVEKNLKEYSDKVAAGDRDMIQSAVEALKKVKDGEDTADINAKVEALTQASMKLGEAMYKAQGGGGAAGDGPTAGPEAGGGDAKKSGEDVVDADFEEVDENKKNKSA